MNRSEKEIRIQAYLAGELNKKDKKEFDDWLMTDFEAQCIFKNQVQQYQQVRWSQKWDSIHPEIAHQQILTRLHRQRKITYLRYAASFAILVFSTLFYLWNNESESSQDSTNIVRIYPITSNTPVLKLSNGQEISIATQTKEIIQSTKQVNIRMTESDRIEYLPKTDSSFCDLKYNTLLVPQGCEFQLALADGSQVWLNAESSLTYPETFATDKREVFLTGEAYFEIKSAQKSPFIVHAGEMRLQVLGTSFNIKAYKDEETITTTLITGKVEQFYPKIQQQILLTPSQQSTYNRTNQKLKTQIVNTSEALAWREGKIIANDERLEDIFKQLTRWYDFDVVYTSPELKDIRFHFQSKRYTETQTILEHIQTTKGIRFSYIGNTVYISK